MSIPKRPSESRDLQALFTLKDRLKHLSVLALTDQLLADQRTRFALGCGEQAESYFELFPVLLERENSESAVDLIYSEFLQSEKYGLAVSQVNILERFPTNAVALKRQFQIYEALSEADFRNMASSRSSHQEDSEDSISSRFESNVALYQSYLDGGRFRIDKTIGEGTFALVFKAWDNTLRRWVAIKFAKNAYDPGSVEHERFLREAKSAAGMAHPGIIAVYEFGNKDRHPFIVQEYASGGTLKDRIQTGDYTVEDAGRWVNKLADAIDYAHQFGVVHRDIKPANILFGDTREPKVADFGLVALADQESLLTRHGDLIGTPSYMSPEQASGSSVGPSSDTYSLGVVLYELLFGRPPFVGSARSVIEQVIQKPATIPAEFQATVPKDLQVICLKAMSKSPSDRYQTTQEMAQDLRRFAHGEPIVARPPGALEKVTRWCVRQPMFALTILAATVSLFVLGGISLVGINYERNRFREQRDIANDRLMVSLINAAETRMRTKQGDWYDATIGDIKRAAELDINSLHTTRLRELAVETFSDTSYRVEQDRQWQGAKTPITAIGAGGEAVAIGYSDGTIAITNTELDGPPQLLAGPQSSIQKLSVFHNGKGSWLFALANGELWRWNLNSKKRRVGEVIFDGVTDFRVQRRQLNTDPTLAIAFAEGYLAQISILNLRETARVRLPNDSRLVSMCYSPSGTLVGAGFADCHFRIWDFGSGQERYSKRLEYDPVFSCSILDDNAKFCFTTKVTYRTSSFTETGFANNFNHSPALDGAVRQIDTLPNGQCVAGTDDGSIVFLNSSQNILAKSNLPKGQNCFAINDASGAVFVGDDSGQVTRIKQVRARVPKPFSTSHSFCFDAESNLYTPREWRSTDAKVRKGMENNSASSIASGDSEMLVVGMVRGDLMFRRDAESEFRTIENAHSKRIVSVGVGEAGRWIFSADSIGRIRIWDVDSLTCLQEFQSDLRQTFAVASHPSSSYLAAIGKFGVDVCKIESDGKSHSPIRRIDSERSFRGSIDVHDSLICYTNKKEVKIVDVVNEERTNVELVSKDEVLQVAFSRSGTELNAMTEYSFERWKVKDNEIDYSWSHENPLTSFAIDSNNGWVAFLNRSPATIVLNPSSGAKFSISMSRHHATPLFGSNGELLIADSGVKYVSEKMMTSLRTKAKRTDRAIQITMPNQWLIPGDSWNAIWGIDCSPMQKWVASAGHDQQVTIRDLESLRIVKVLTGFKHEVWRAIFSPDDRYLATASEGLGKGDLAIWNTDDWSIKHRIELSNGLLAGLTFHPSLPWLAVSSFDGGVFVVDYETGKLIHELVASREKEKVISFQAMDVMFSPDGKWLAAACKLGGAKIWSVDVENAAINSRQEIAELHPKNQRIWSVAFDANSQRLAVGSETGQIDLYDVNGFVHLVTMRSAMKRIRKLRFSQDEKFLGVSTWASSSMIWDLELLEEELDQIGLGLEANVQ